MKFLIALVLAAFVCSSFGASIEKRDVKSDLLDKAAALEKQATAEAKKLTAAGKTAEAAKITAEEKRLVTLAAELKAATEDAAVKRLENEVKAIEARIADEIKKAEGSTGTPAAKTTKAAKTAKTDATTAAPLEKRDLRDTLLTRAEALEKSAADAIAKLKADGRTAQAAGLQREETRLQTLAAELKAATGEAAIRRLDTEVRAVENRIAEELRRIEGRPTGRPSATTTAPVKRDVKSDLLDKAATLEKQATAEAKKLTAAGKTAAAARITAEEKRLVTLAAELKAATEDAAVKRLENEVKAIETRIADEIKRAEGSTGTPAAKTTKAAKTSKTDATTAAPLEKRDVKSDLLARAEVLEKQATAEAAKLTAAGKTAAAERITADEKRLVTLAAELKDATGDAAIRQLEGEVRAIELRIAEEIRRAE